MTLSLELLEDRTLLSPYIVTTTADSGVGSLRDAITQINADTSHTLYPSPTDPTKYEIDFDIPTTDPGYNSGTASFTIQPNAGVPDPTYSFTGLPLITNSVIIDGYTQPGASPNTLAGGDNAALKIELNGANAGASSGVGLVLDAPNCTVEGLVINGFGAYGVWTLADGENISGNFIGTDVTGTTALPNSTSTASPNPTKPNFFNLEAQNGAVQVYGNNNVIGGTDAAARNVISGNDADGIVIKGYLDPATGTDVMGNFIGTDATGTLPLGNASDGIGVFGQYTIIGGTTAGARNIISANTGTQYLDENGFAGNGVYTGGDVGTVIEGNYVGTDVSGTHALGNAENGIGLGFASKDTIGGTTPGAGNLISGNIVYGAAIGVSQLCQIEGNLIGTDMTGTLPLGNGEGVFEVGNTGGVVGGTDPDARNVISGNRIGVDLRSAGTQVQGNYIGTDITGTSAIDNGIGVYIADEAQDNTIGGLTNIPGTGAGNLISGNAYGIIIESGIVGTSDNAVEGNLIGTDPTGLAALPNDYGVAIRYLASDNTIGGTTPGSANVISDNTVDGVTITGGTLPGGAEATPTDNLVQGNYIGTDMTGTVDLANGSWVVIENGASSNTIGGTTAASRNIISGNVQNGVTISDSGTTGNMVQGNLIGTAAGGVAALHNGGDGILLGSGASSNSIGGTTSGAANTIAYNTGIGVAVTGNTSTGNSIRGNSIHDNGALGIDLGADGVTLNTPGGPHTGPNDLQNYPVLSAASTGPTPNILGTLNSTPKTTFVIDVYANPVADPSGHGQGEYYLGPITVSTDASGNASFNANLSAAGIPGGVLPAGWAISATATDPAGNTSEFSGNGKSVTPAILILNLTAPGALSLSGNASINVTGTVVVDSNSTTALTANGNASVKGSVIDVVGNDRKTGNATFSPAPVTGAAVVADPYANLAEPSTSGLTDYGAVNVSGKNSATLSPGIYTQITVSGNAAVTLDAGVYILEGGGFTVSGNATVKGNSVTIFNAGSKYPSTGGSYGSIDVSGNAGVTLTAPSTGTYTGVFIFQARDNAQALSVSGNAIVASPGTVYLPDAPANLSGNAMLETPLVVNELSLSGNSDPSSIPYATLFAEVAGRTTAAAAATSAVQEMPEAVPAFGSLFELPRQAQETSPGSSAWELQAITDGWAGVGPLGAIELEDASGGAPNLARSVRFFRRSMAG